MSEPVRGIVVAHADLARALIEAVDRIVGLGQETLQAVSNEGMGPGGIRQALEEIAGEGPAILFTDLREGSCGMAARHLCMGREDHVLVTGVNLPMLLDFALNRDRPLEELVERVVERGRRAVQRIPEAE
jgi:mannose/fructose-specific phosphotransferase system component IIA